MFEAINRNIALNFLSGFLAALGIAGILCSWGVQSSWSAAAPKFPDPSHGYIIAQHIKLKPTFYYSPFQAVSSSVMDAASFICFFFAICVRPKRNILFWTSFGSIRASWDQDDPFHAMWQGAVAGVIATPVIYFVIGPVVMDLIVASGIASLW